MKSLLSLVAAGLLVGSASAQNVLTEGFDAAIPPAGWTLVNNNANPLTQGWIPGTLDPWTLVDHTGWAWHEDEFSSNGTSDNSMVSPAMDLTAVSGTAMTMVHEMRYSTWMAHMGGGDGISSVEVSTDGGLTWTNAWTYSATADAVYTECIDLSAYDGMASVQVAIRFFGTYSQENWVDRVSVDGGGCGSGGGLAYGITGLVGGGVATLSVTGATPAGGVLIGYSFTGAGPTVTPFGPVDMSAPISQLPALTADSAGTAAMSVNVPAGASGMTVYTQAADLTTGTLTNSLAELIR